MQKLIRLLKSSTAAAGVTSLLASCLSLMLLTVLPSRHRLEMPVNLWYGFLAGCVAWAAVAVSARFADDIPFLNAARRVQRQRLALQALAIAILACLPVALVALAFGKPLVGMLAIIGWGLPVPTAILAHHRVQDSSWKVAGWAVLPLALLLAALAAAGPLAPRPDHLRYLEPEPEDLVVLSWNVGTAQPFSTASQPGHLEGIARVIAASGAHVVCLQEVGGPEHLASLIGYLGLITPAEEAGPHPVVVAGDFDLDPECWWDRTSSMLTDDLALDRRSLALLRDHWADAGRAGAATSILSRRMDFVLVPPAVSCVEYRVLFGKRLGRMDYRPVSVRLRAVDNGRIGFHSACGTRRRILHTPGECPPAAG